MLEDVYDFVEKNAKDLDAAMEYDRDLGYDYFGSLDEMNMVPEQIVMTDVIFQFYFPHPNGRFWFSTVLHNTKEHKSTQ